MAFDVVLYTFSKKSNSTGIPSAAGTTYSCTAKMPLDILSPVIQLQLTGGAAANPSSFNYARIRDFSRYYYITSWRNVGPVWEAQLRVDALASWRTQLGTQSVYVYRSSNQFNRALADSVYPVTATVEKTNVSLPKIWTVGGASESGAASGSGVFVIGIMTNDRGVVYGAFTPVQFEAFINALFSDDYYEQVLTEFGAIEYPEAKVAVNPMQFITSCKFCPVGLITSGYWGLRYIDETFGITVGPASLSFLQTPVSWYRLTNSSVPSGNAFSLTDIQITAAYKHPQAAARGEWLNYAPYTSYELFYPPFGLLELDPVAVSSHNYLRVRLSLDARTCTCTLEVQVYDLPADIRTILRLQAAFGIDVDLSNIMQPGTSAMQILGHTVGGIMQAAGGLISGDTGSVLGGIYNTINGGAISSVNGRIPHTSYIGGPGSTASLDGYPKLYISHWIMADDDNTDRGRPLCAVRQISAVPGYIMADSDSISIACTASELQEIRGAVSGGFYYE